MKRILVITTRQIGDVLLTTPVVRAARACWPAARIEVLGFKGTLGMLQPNGEISALIETPAKLGLRGFWALLRRLWRRYDLALVAQSSDRAHLMGWVAAPLRSGIVPAHSSSSWWKTRLLRHVVASAGDGSATHVTVEKLALLAPWMPGAAPVPRVMPPEATALPEAVAQQLRPGCVVVHAPSMWNYKQWPLPYYSTVVQALLDQGRQVVLTGSAGARDQACVAPLKALAAAPQLLDVSGQLDFGQLAALLGRAALYIGPDTSISHLAAAVGLPVIAIFGPTNPQRWAPWPATAEAQAVFARSALVQQAGNVRLLQGRQACVPCSHAGCDDHVDSRSDCLHDIAPERVLAEVAKVLGRPTPGASFTPA
jgi:heptosyltransferase-3